MRTTHESAFNIFNKLKDSRRPYVITGSHASFQYHHWLYPIPKIVELRIHAEDYDYWMNSLNGEAAYISEIPPTTDVVKNINVAVLLASNLSAQIYHNRRTFSDLHYEAPEDLCVEFLQNLVAEITVMEILAILLAQRHVFRWNYFCEQVAVLGLARDAGILLEVINEHTQQRLMPQTIIDQFFNKIVQAEAMNDRCFPHTWRVKLALKRQNENEKDVAVTYPRTSQKWGVKVVLPRYIMDKLVLDLGYSSPDQSFGKASEFENIHVVANRVA
jgi:hypothetical protein